MQRTVSSAPSKTISPAQFEAQHGIDLGHELTRGVAANVIRTKARQFIRRAGFSKSDREDLEQQFMQRVLESLHTFDPSQGHFNVFVKTVVERFATNILRDARTAKRDQRGTRSLSMIVGEDEVGPVSLGDTLSCDDRNRRLGTDSRDPLEEVCLAMDADAVIANLPAELRDLRERLQYQKPSEVARDLNLPRSTIEDWMKKLREHFASAGLEK